MIVEEYIGKNLSELRGLVDEPYCNYCFHRNKCGGCSFRKVWNVQPKECVENNCPHINKCGKCIGYSEFDLIPK